MPKLTIMHGLPASGKTTFAKKLVQETGNTVRVNRDELRKMLHCGLNWTGEREKITVATEKCIVASALKSGKNVVIDDTNLLGSGADKWKTWADEGFGYAVLSKPENGHAPISVDVQDFTKTISMDTCIERDARRTGDARVGRGVIERMALRGGLIDLSKYEKVAIIDIDGTVADLTHRLHYIQSNPKDYDGFFAHVNFDSIITTVRDAVLDLAIDGHTIIFLSGRPTTVGHETNEWLMRAGLPVHHLFMRRGGDHKPDHEAKREIFQSMLSAGLQKDAVKVVIDDRDCVCDVWREFELPLIQVKDGFVVQLGIQSVQQGAGNTFGMGILCG